MDSIDIFRQKNVILNVLIIFVAFFVAANIYSSQSKSAQLLKVLEMKEKEKNRIMHNISGLEKELETYSDFMIKRDVGFVIDRMNNYTQGLGVKIVQIKPETELSFGDYTKTSYTVTLEVSSYTDLALLVSKIESAGEVFVVEDIEIRPEGQKSGILTVALRVSNITLVKK